MKAIAARGVSSPLAASGKRDRAPACERRRCTCCSSYGTLPTKMTNGPVVGMGLDAPYDGAGAGACCGEAYEGDAYEGRGGGAASPPSSSAQDDFCGARNLLSGTAGGIAPTDRDGGGSVLTTATALSRRAGQRRLPFRDGVRRARSARRNGLLGAH